MCVCVYKSLRRLLQKALHVAEHEQTNNIDSTQRFIVILRNARLTKKFRRTRDCEFLPVGMVVLLVRLKVSG